jgi:hypothetical protein
MREVRQRRRPPALGSARGNGKSSRIGVVKTKAICRNRFSWHRPRTDDAVASSGRVSTCPVPQLKGVPDGKAPKLRRFAA